MTDSAQRLELDNIIASLQGHAAWLRNYKRDPNKYSEPTTPDALERIADRLAALLSSLPEEGTEGLIKTLNAKLSEAFGEIDRLRTALRAIDDITRNPNVSVFGKVIDIAAAAAALRSSAIPEEGEPVAWRWRTRLEDNWTFSNVRLSLNDVGRTSATFQEQPLYARPSPDGAVRKALERSRNAIRSLYHEIDNPAMPAILAAAWEVADIALSTAPQQGGEPVVTRPLCGAAENTGGDQS